MCLCVVLVLRALCAEVLIGSADTARHDLAITTAWVFLSSLAHCGATSFAFTSAFSTIEDLVYVFVGVFAYEVESGFSSAFALAFALKEFTDLAYWFPHVFAPI